MTRSQPYLPNLIVVSSASTAVSGACGNLYELSGGTGTTFTLPDASKCKNGWIGITNTGSVGHIAMATTSSQSISTNMYLYPVTLTKAITINYGTGILYYCFSDGTQWYMFRAQDSITAFIAATS